MYLWRKIAGRRWVDAQENVLQARACGGLAIINKSGCKRLQVEIACSSRSSARALIAQFGGRAEKLPRDWLQRFARGNKSNPQKIGKRLVISNVPGSPMSPVSRGRGCLHMVIPAGRAFGTGEHVTTAMSLRILERLTRRWKHGWSLVDLGTGSGILALAAKGFGAGRVVGVDNDPITISIAESNAQLNNVHGANFRLGDVRRWKPGNQIDIVTANLYCDLLLDILPKLKRTDWLILSGILRREADEFCRAVRQNNTQIVEIKGRGKWIAILARNVRL